MPTENDEEKPDRDAARTQTYIVELTRAEALSQGVIHCECGHPPNNHFDHGERSCAHCGCEKLRECVSIGRDASNELAASRAERDRLQNKVADLTIEIAGLTTELHDERDRAHEARAERDQLRAELSSTGDGEHG